MTAHVDLGAPFVTNIPVKIHPGNSAELQTYRMTIRGACGEEYRRCTGIFDRLEYGIVNRHGRKLVGGDLADIRNGNEFRKLDLHLEALWYPKPVSFDLTEDLARNLPLMGRIRGNCRLLGTLR
jgi:hypothetical protein